jgi:hypothetical protein
MPCSINASSFSIFFRPSGESISEIGGLLLNAAVGVASQRIPSSTPWNATAAAIMTATVGSSSSVETGCCGNRPDVLNTKCYRENTHYSGCPERLPHASPCGWRAALTVSNIPCETDTRARAVPNRAAPRLHRGVVAAPSARQPKSSARLASQRNRLPKQILVPAHNPRVRKPAEAARDRSPRPCGNSPRRIQPALRRLAARPPTTVFVSSPLCSPLVKTKLVRMGLRFHERAATSARQPSKRDDRCNPDPADCPE